MIEIEGEILTLNRRQKGQDKSKFIDASSNSKQKKGF